MIKSIVNPHAVHTLPIQSIALHYEDRRHHGAAPQELAQILESARTLRWGRWQDCTAERLREIANEYWGRRNAEREKLIRNCEVPQMIDLTDAAGAAALYKVTRSTISRAAERAGIATVKGRFLFTAAQLKQLGEFIHGKPGCPAFSDGNELWKHRSGRNANHVPGGEKSSEGG